MRRIFFSALALTITVLMTACSSGSGGSSGGGGTSVFVPGKWTITLFSNSGSLFANTVELDLDLTQSGTAISSDTNHSIDGASCAGMHVDSSTGSVSDDTIKLVFSIDSEQITMKGKLSPDGKTILSGTFTPGNGSCISGAPINIMGGWTPGLNGSFSGGIQTPDAAPTVTAMLAEDASFDVTGNMDVVGDTCFSTLSTAADNPGLSIGDLSSFEMTDGTNVVDFVGQIEQAPGLPTEYDANFTVAAGCTEQTGRLTLDVTSGDAIPLPASRAAKTVAHKINPLLIERMKTALDASRVQLMDLKH